MLKSPQIINEPCIIEDKLFYKCMLFIDILLIKLTLITLYFFIVFYFVTK